MARKIFFLLLSFFALSTAYADVIVGRVVDAASGEPIPFASFSFTQLTENVVSVLKGEADSVGNLRGKSGFGNIRVKVEALGYYPQTRFCAAGGMEGDTIFLGDIALKPSEMFMDEAIVVAHERKFVMHGDTVVFNPRAFKLQQGARLDELIQKLPGVSVRDGKLYWNDKPLRIMMNGEELFMGAEQLTQMLPVEAVENIKTYNKASDFAEKTGRDDGKEDQVLDVNIKKGFLDKWYGDLMGAYQTEAKGEVKVDAYKLSTHDPLMLYLDVNNLSAIDNFKSFRSKSFSSNMDNSKQHFGAFGYKHQFNGTQGKKTLRRETWIAGNLGHTDRASETRSLQETYFPGTDRTFQLSRDYDYTHTLNPTAYFGLSMDLDTLWRLDLTGRASYKKQEVRTQRRNAVFDADAYNFSKEPLDAAFREDASDSIRRHLVNSTDLSPFTQTEATDAKLHLSLERYLHGNSSISLRGNVEYENSESQRYQQNNYKYYREPEKTRNDAQYDNAPSHHFSTDWELAYKVWLSKQILFSPSYDFSYQKGFEKDFIYLSNEGLDRQTFFDLPATALDTLFDRSNSMSNSYTKTSSKVHLEWLFKLGQVSLSPTLNYERLHETSGYYRGSVDTAASRSNDLWSPSFYLQWKIKRGHSFSASYSANNNLPDLVSTIAFRDESNPLSITEGNPNLRNSWTHNAKMSYSAAIQKNAQSISVSLNYTKDTHPIQTLFYYNEKSGVYRSRPENVRGCDRWALMLSDEMTIKDVFNIRNDLQFTHTRSYGYLTTLEGETPLLNKQKSLRLRWNPNLAYEKNNLMVSVRGNVSYRYDDNSEEVSVGNRFWNVEINYYASYKWKNFEVGTQVRDKFAHGYTIPQMNRHSWLWDAHISWQCLKNKGRLKIEVNDILNKDKYYASELSAYHRTETRYYFPHHYLNLSFTYHFDAKSDKKQGQR